MINWMNDETCSKNLTALGSSMEDHSWNAVMSWFVKHVWVSEHANIADIAMSPRTSSWKTGNDDGNIPLLYTFWTSKKDVSDRFGILLGLIFTAILYDMHGFGLIP